MHLRTAWWIDISVRDFSTFCYAVTLECEIKEAACYGAMTSRLTPGMMRVVDDLVISTFAVTQIGDLTIKQWLAVNYGLTVGYSYFDDLNIDALGNNFMKHIYRCLLREMLRDIYVIQTFPFDSYMFSFFFFFFEML